MPGSGHVRRFPAEQVDRAILIRSLLAAGMTLQRGIRDVIDQVADTGHIDLGEVTLTIRRDPSGDAA